MNHDADGPPRRVEPPAARMTGSLRPPSSSLLSATPPLLVTVRFLSLPDIQLDISDPGRVTVAGLKVRIRRQLAAAARKALAEPPTPTSTKSAKALEKQPATSSSSFSSSSPTPQDAHRRRLRILYGGKLLTDNVVLGSVLRPVPPPPRANRASSVSTPLQDRAATPVTAADLSDDGGSASGYSSASGASGAAAAAARVYVSCSLGDILPDSEIAAEEADAAVTAAVADRNVWRGGTSSLLSSSSSSLSANASQRQRLAAGGTTRGQGSGADTDGGTATADTTPPPRGFDRLLQAGFTPAEVNQLRLQFTSIQSTRFTPDSMPSPDALRTMEENWLDNNNGGGGAVGDAGGGAMGTTAFAASGTGGGGEEVPADDDFGLPGLLEIMVRGMLIGFVFPLGSTCWLAREEGLWTRRWRVFVSFGVMVSLAIGSIKSLAGEW